MRMMGWHSQMMPAAAMNMTPWYTPNTRVKNCSRPFFVPSVNALICQASVNIVATMDKSVGSL